MREIFVESKKDVSLSKYILDIYENLKYSVLKKALRNKDIRVNDKKISKDCNVKLGDKINIYISDYLLFDFPKKLDYIYQDENILAVYKPQGLLSNIEYYEDEEDINKKYSKMGGLEPTLESIVKADLESAIICHRLDRNTSGIVLFALNENSYKEILNGFKFGLIKKEYIAYVSGSNFSKNSDILQNYILKDSKTGYSKVYENMVKDSQKIITKYNVIKIDKKNDYAILNISIPTGKTHQIRAQMKAIDHNIIGDSKYGKNEINKKFKVYKQLLFAYKYSFKFEKNSILYYLNEIDIVLDERIYMKKLGE